MAQAFRTGSRDLGVSEAIKATMPELEDSLCVPAWTAGRAASHRQRGRGGRRGRRLDIRVDLQLLAQRDDLQ